MCAWERPDENSIEGLLHGMEFADGVEFDLRVDGDGEFVIFHDEFVPGSGRMLDRCVEKLPTDYIRSVGVSTLDELLANREFHGFLAKRREDCGHRIQATSPIYQNRDCESPGIDDSETRGCS